MAHIPTEERREQLIAAAKKVIAERGIAGATTRAIAAEAGSPVATLHCCFGTKEELFEAVSHNFGDVGLERAMSSVTPGMGLIAASRAVLQSTAQYISGNLTGELTEFEFYAWALRNGRSEITKRVYGKWIDGIANALESGRRSDEADTDVEAIARMIITFWDGYGLQDLMLQENNIHEATDLAARVIEAAILARAFEKRR